MVLFKYKDKEYYIDERLKKQLDKKVIPDLMKRDKDKVFCVDGEEGSGKSKFADLLGGYIASQVGTNYDLSNVCLEPMDFRNRIQNCKKNEVIIYDEAHKGMGSRRALSEINNILIDLMMEMRQKNLFVIVVLPTYFMLDKYVALFRTTGLFHIYERKGKRGFWVYFNRKNKLKLYLKGKPTFNYNCVPWPKFRGRFTNQYVIDETEYRKKKEEAFKEKPKTTRAEVWKEQRDRIIKLLAEKEGKTLKHMVDTLSSAGVKMEKSVLHEIIRGKPENTSVSGLKTLYKS